MGAMSFSVGLRNARGEAIINKINNGAGAGTMLFYTSPRPAATGGAVTTQTLLGTVAFSEPAGTVEDGVTTFDVVTDDSSADANGDAVWARVLDGDGAFVIDWDVTDNAGVGPVKMPSVTIYEGGVIHVTSAVITEGNA